MGAFNVHRWRYRLPGLLRLITVITGSHFYEVFDMRLNQVTVRVSDIHQSLEFYKGLGLMPIVAGLDHYARFLCPEGDSTFSIEKISEGKPQSTTTVYFECDNLDAKVAE